MNVGRTHRKLNRTPEDVARLKAVRERYQNEKLTVEQPLAECGNEDTMPLGELLLVPRRLPAALTPPPTETPSADS